MTNKAAQIPFAIRLFGSVKEIQLRVRSIFRWKKEHLPIRLFSFVVFILFGCMGLVSCARRQLANDVLFLNTAAGRELMVELELEPTRQEHYYAVTQLRVMEQERTLQVIDPSELTTAYGIEGLYILRGHKIGQPDIRDFNFDGSKDLALLAESTIPQNPSYLFFLWSREKRELEASFVMTGLPELDEQQKEITEKMTNGRRRYYDWQEGWMRENPASRQTMEPLEQIGESFEQFDDLQFKNINIPDASGQCMYNVENGVSYYFFGTQGLPGLAELPQEHTRRLKCAGIVSTVGELFPQITEGTPLNWFCDTLEITDYSYGYEDAVDQGWLCFDWENYTVWIDTNNPSMEQYDPTAVVVGMDDVILFVDETTEKENYLICEEYWNEIMMAEIMG